MAARRRRSEQDPNELGHEDTPRPFDCALTSVGDAGLARAAEGYMRLMTGWKRLFPIALAGGLITACAAPARVALPMPFPLTYGGSPVPARGVAASGELGDALRGQELQRAEVLTAAVTLGLFDRFTGSIAVYGGHETDDPSGSLWRVKVRAISPFGPRSSTSLQLALAEMSRQGSAQNERLRAVDVALPTEFLLARRPSASRFSLYLGPRVTIEHYDDLLDPAQSLQATYLGLLGGIHFNAGIFHLFAEATLVHVPRDQYQGQTYGGYWSVSPTFAIVFHTGRAYGWQAPP